MGNKWNKTKLDFEQLRIEIRSMSRQSQLFKLLREELAKLDHWKQQGRGNPQKAHNMIRNNKINGKGLQK